MKQIVLAGDASGELKHTLNVSKGLLKQKLGIRMV